MTTTRDPILEPFIYLVVIQSPTHNQFNNQFNNQPGIPLATYHINHTAHPCSPDNCLLNKVSTGHLRLLPTNQSTTGLQVNNHLNPTSTGQTLYLHLGLLHPSGKGNLINNFHRPPTGPINHPVPGQLQSTRQQNYTFPVDTTGQQNRVIDNQQHQPPISHPVNIPHINSHVPPTQQFNRTGLYQPNTNQSGFQQPLNNTMGSLQATTGATSPKCYCTYTSDSTAIWKYTISARRPYQPSTAPNLVQGMTQSGYYDTAPHLPVYPQQLYNNRPHTQFQDQRSMSSITSCSNSDSDSSSSTSGVVYRRSRHKRSHKTHSRLSISSRHVSPVEEEASEHSSPHRKEFRQEA
ncbi:unnamed protein product [Mytilus edulis]|uniref:Uncharacterized protein n=1 Tax=Mytilus edulis TaxID=6550 RepID=A0A8S3TUL1_MYTED|nr:unnamed protein product [Mytilus edulis]